MIIEANNVSFSFDDDSHAHVEKVLTDINLKIEKGSMTGVIGHTGCGKSTLLRMFNGLLKPDSGKVLVDGVDIWKDKETLRQSRFKVGLCFQYPEYQLFEETVYKDIAFGPKNMKLSEAEIKERVLRAAEFTGVKAEHLNKSPFDLSGGEKRRAAIAGVMSMEPQVLIFDEPAAGLDPKGRDKVLDEIHQYHEESGTTILLVSHSMEDMARTVDRLVVFNGGKIPFQGTPREVFCHGQELEDMGLGVPQMTRVFNRLRAMGVDIDPAVYTTEQAKQAILAKLGKGGK